MRSTAPPSRATEPLLRAGVSRTVTLNSGVEPVDVFVETHVPPETLIIVGAGDVGIPLARMAKIIGLRVIVVDARERFATRDRFPDADEIRVGIPSEIVESLPLGDSTYVVLVVHDYKYEVPVLTRVLEQPVAYVGLLGSRRRGKALREFLAEQGIDEDALSRIHVPVGLEHWRAHGAGDRRQHSRGDARDACSARRRSSRVRAHRITRDALDPVRLEGMVLCEDVRDSTGRPALKKGQVLGGTDLPTLGALEWTELHVIERDRGELLEEDAGRQVAGAAAGEGTAVGTFSGGHWAIAATRRGVLEVEVDTLAKMNRIEGVCVYTLYDGQIVDAGELVARAKITPFVLRAEAVERAEELASEGNGIVRVREFRPARIAAVVQERLDERALARFRQVLGEKAAWFGASLERRPRHARRCRRRRGRDRRRR